MKAPAQMKARAIGAYSRGCLAGATALPIDGPAWQAMRLSRNRNWGHPKLVALLEKYAGEVKTKDGWPGLLVGDISQPRGGPMLTGHASHQLGLDADIWFTPMPSRRLSKTERENLAATSMLASDNLSVNRKVWGEGQVNIVRRVASYPEVERVLVHPAIKKALCEAGGKDRGWLSKVRPYWGHFYHFHVRIGCPSDSPTCTKQAPIPGDDGCGKELDDWFKLLTAPPKPKPPVAQPAKPVKPKPPLTLADLPAECRTVVGDDAAVITASDTAPAKKTTPAVPSKTAATVEKKPPSKKAADAK
jgi:penicillin-insensitive murein endopeptidase